MTELTAVVVVVGVATLLNVALTLSLASRVRAFQSLLDPHPFPSIGTRVVPFRVSAIGGGSICERDLAVEPAIVAFLDGACEPCLSLVTRLIESPPREPLFAFVGAADHEAHATELARSLAPIAQVAIVEPDSPVMTSFGIKAFPTLLRLEGGAVVAAGERLERISDTNGAAPDR